MATDCSEVSIAQQTDGTFVVIVNDEVLSEALWGRSKVFRDIVEDCEHDAEVHTSISIPTRQMSLWQAEISEGKSIVDVESLCIVLKVCTSEHLCCFRTFSAAADCGTYCESRFSVSKEFIYA